MSIQLTSSARCPNASQLPEDYFSARGSNSHAEFPRDVSMRLVPDAQGNVSREELVFAAVRSLLSTKEPQLENRFLCAFDELLDSGSFSDSTISIVEAALNRLIGDKLLDTKQAAELIQQATGYSETL